MYVNSFIQGIRARFYDITPCSQFQSSISCATTFTTGASFSSQWLLRLPAKPRNHLVCEIGSWYWLTQTWKKESCYVKQLLNFSMWCILLDFLLRMMVILFFSNLRSSVKWKDGTSSHYLKSQNFQTVSQVCWYRHFSWYLYFLQMIIRQDRRWWTCACLFPWRSEDQKDGSSFFFLSPFVLLMYGNLDDLPCLPSHT